MFGQPKLALPSGSERRLTGETEGVMDADRSQDLLLSNENIIRRGTFLSPNRNLLAPSDVHDAHVVSGTSTTQTNN
jgi:hypothetical protein